jgi:sugar transferase (PEP-CTERM/EpsH1 system associated)
MPGSPRLWNLCRELARRHELTLLMKEGARERYDALLADPATSSTFAKTYLSTRWVFPDFHRDWCERVRERSAHVDVIVADGLEMTQYVRDVRVPAVAELHDSLSLLMARSADREVRFLRRVRVRAESWSLARWERELGRRFALVVTNSEVDAEQIRRLDPRSPVKAIGNGVDSDYFRPDPSIEVEPGRVVFTGVMDYEPNADAAQYFGAEILPLVRARAPHAEFWVVGHSPTPAVKALASAPGIHVTGGVDDVRPHVQRSQVFACPLRFGAGIKNKILAAMAMGRPVVATPISLHAIEAKPEVEVLVGETPERFAAQILRLLEDDQLAETIGEAGRRMVQERYSWRSAAATLEAELRGFVVGSELSSPSAAR